MKRGLAIRKKWKWIAGVFAVFLVIFTAVGLYRHLNVSNAAGPYTFTNSNGDVVAAGGQMDLRRATDVLTLSGYEAGDTYEWQSTDETILKVTGTSYSANLQVQGKVGDVTLNVKIKHAADNPAHTAEDSEEVVSLKVRVIFSINEYLSPNAPAGVRMERIKPDDARKSLIMDYGRLPAGSTNLNSVEKSSIDFGKSAVTEQNKLNLIFGDATDSSTVWSSSNDDVFMVNNTTHTLTAMGAGVATLSVEYTDGTTTHTDSIKVYVRPLVLNDDDDKTVIAGATNTDTKIVEVHNGDKLGLTAEFVTNPLESISDKVSWVISKGEGENTVLVRDSLGNTGSGGKDATLEWRNGEQKYRINARAGVYNIQFYVKGTYTSFEAAKENPPACRPVSLQAKVLANYEDKNVTVNIGGSYNLAEAFNIPEDVFVNNFDVSYFDNESATYVKINADQNTVDAIELGTGKLKIHPRPNSAAADIPGMPKNLPDAEVTITVSETFVMSQSSLTLPVGSSIQLYGVIGSNTVADANRFSWKVSDPSYVSINTNEGQYATITALRRTPVGSPVIVTLTWQDEEAVYHTATCTVTVTESVNNFSISPATETLEIGGESKLLDTKLSGTQNIQWISSDPNKVTVSPVSGNAQAMISPAKTTGQAVITAINLDNGVYATCLVTVTAPITSLTIDKGTSYETTLAEGIVQLRAIYQPANATDTTMRWVSSDPDVATVDENGRVTLLKEGTTRISVQPVVNPNGVWAACDIHIVENPIIKITPSETEIDMIAGDTYEVVVTLTPENPSDRTLRWSSSDESIAKVEGGVITAVSAGDATISITGGKVGSETDPVTIKVHVRNRLQKIEFATKTTYIAVGGTQQLTVLFTPNVAINDKLIWKSSDDSIVTVTDEGVITGIKVGSAMISCYAEDMGPNQLITCMVYVTDALVVANNLTVLPESATMQVGEILQMDAVFDPDNTTDQSIRWSSSDESIITITEGGLVTAQAVGQATITAIYYNTPDGTPWVRYSKIVVEPATVIATGFEVTPDSANIKVRESFRITPVFTPENTTDKTVIYQSTDESVATVDENGVVRGVGAGDALIQCQAISGGFIDACAVHVENAIDFRLSPSTREIAVGKSFTLKKITVPSNADKTATWTSSNSKIATVNSSGKVTGKKIGSCTITCTLTEYNQSATCRVKVAKLNSKVKFNKKSIRVGRGKTYQIKATVWSNNSKNPSLTWKSANKRIATVSSKGKVKGKRLGVTKVTAVTKDKVKAKATCRVTVIRPVSSVKMSTAFAICYVGHTKQLRATVKPKNASIKKLKWTSSDKSIATVSSTGKVTGMKAGEVTITAKAKDGSGKKATCFLKVLEEVPASDVVVAQTELTLKKGDTTTLSYSVLPNNNSDRVRFASDNRRVATVDSNGKIKAVGTGTANITIMTDSGVTTTVVVNVVSLDRTVLNIRQYDTESLQVLGTDANITWYTANSRVATVTNGTVVGRGLGSTYIYAYVNGCKMACVVNVVSVNQ